MSEEIKEEKIDCHECSHVDVCRIWISSDLEKRIEQPCMIGKKAKCGNFYYKKKDQYLMSDFKDLLKRKIDNSDNAHFLLVLYEIFKLMEAGSK